MTNNDIDDFAKYLMQQIKSDFMFRVKEGRKTYSMEEILWIVHENIEECVLMYDYDGKPEKQKPDIRIQCPVDNSVYDSWEKYIKEYGQMSDDIAKKFR
jgi:hypothetical protein